MTTEDFKLVRSLFHQAFDLNEHDRSSLLDRKCLGRPDVRSEVEGLLRALRKAQIRFDPDDSSIAQQLLGPSNTEPGSDPAQIGPYEIVRRIGQGGMGVVYLARQSQPRREVALKVLRSGLALEPGMAGRRRFEREIRLLGLLQHPGIAQIFEAGVADVAGGAGGMPYFAMEYIDGQPLNQHAASRKLSVHARLELMAQVADAVHHAHSKGIIHRDLKPSNIVVTDAAVPKVLDFGVARALDPDAQQTRHTEPGLLVGTIAYMSPEQLAGDPQAADTRADVYSLGVILFELLTGELPYDLRDKPLAEAARIIRDTEPRLLNDVRRAEVPARRDFDRDVRAIAAKVLEKDPSRRYQSADQFGEDLRRYLRHEAVMAHAQTRWYQFRKFARRNRGALAAALGMLILLTGGIAGTSIGMLRALSARDAEHQQRQRAEAISRFIESAIQSSDPLAGGKQDMRVSEAMRAAVEQLNAGVFRDQPEAEAELCLTIAKALTDNGHAADALPLAQRAVSTFESRRAGNDANLARAEGMLGTVLHAVGRLADAEPHCRKSLAMLQRLHREDHPDVAQAMSSLEAVLAAMGRYTEADRLGRDVLELRRRMHKGDHIDVAKSIFNVGAGHQVQSRDDEAEQSYRDALAMTQRLYPDGHPFAARIMGCLAQVALRRGLADEADRLSRDSVALAKRLFPGGHPEVAMSLNIRAIVLRGTGRTARAVPLLREALALQQRLIPGDHAQLAWSMNNLGGMLVQLDRADEGEPLLREALKMHQRLFPDGHFTSVNCATHLAMCLSKKAGDSPGSPEWSEALVVAGQAAEMARRILPMKHPQRVEAENVLQDLKARSIHD